MLITGAELVRVEPGSSRVRHADLSHISPIGWSELTVDSRGNVYVNTVNFDFADFDDAEPGMSLLRLAQDRVDVALAATRRVLGETSDPIERSRLLPAHVEITLEAGDIAAARVASDELAGIAANFDAPYLHALAAHVLGGVLLWEGDPRAALVKLRDAYD
jgi:hypothetical protein